MEKDSELEATVRDLKAIHEIMNLEADYCYAADSYDGDLFASVFAEDGVLDVIHMGKTVGREALRVLCSEQMPRGLSFSMHFLHNPRIVIDGDRATGKFYWEASLTYPNPNTATRAAGTYDSKYIRTNGGWKIKEKVVNFFYDTPFNKGWVKERFYGRAD
jgi:hypothetical protein